MTSMKNFRGRLWMALCAVWLLIIGIGGTVMSKYQDTPGQIATTPEHWPSGAKNFLARDRATLVMFAHPKCPCTRASVEELNRLLARSSEKISAHVFFLKPKGSPEDWTKTALWKSAAAIPGVTVHEDIDGAQSQRFGAETSGFVALYDASGKLLFKGGITAGRGHAGDNVGAGAVVSLSNGGNPNLRETPVYGCSLFESCEPSTKKNL
jgi:hypothetical protein